MTPLAQVFFLLGFSFCVLTSCIVAFYILASLAVWALERVLRAAKIYALFVRFMYSRLAGRGPR